MEERGLGRKGERREGSTYNQSPHNFVYIFKIWTQNVDWLRYVTLCCKVQFGS